MGPPVRYIPKTHEYYRRLGYPLPYKYARFDTTPFAPLGKPRRSAGAGWAWWLHTHTAILP